jgi:hypothetical protein
MAGESLERRVQRLEDIEEIRRVRGEYALAADERNGCAVNVQRTMKLFAQDGVWDGTPRWGRHEGWETVRQYLSTGNAGIDWSLHWLMDTGIDIDAEKQTASARWYLIEVANMLQKPTTERRLVWLAGLYDDTYVKEGGAWKFRVVRFDCQKIWNA